MQLTKVAAVLSLFGALGVGLAVVYIADSRQEVAVVDGPVQITSTLAMQTPIDGESLVGMWKGTWGRNRADCTIEITRIERDTFYGFLRKEGAVISFVGQLEPEARKVFIQETKVLDLGRTGAWSLGKNGAVISADGLSMSGTGYDQWGQYGWDVWRER